ncbi:MAG: fluoride efflux transporter CrcB [Acidobacteria bacterium]|nr:fluoride efflux transporter CrcB [Acidobacteriota bacterium]
MTQLALVFLGGGIGSVTRWGVSLLAARSFGTRFPWGTLAVNLAGCFLIGLLFSLGTERGLIGPSARLLLMTGFLGGLTTFSTYGLETVSFALSESRPAALFNILLNNVLGLALAVLGIWVGRAR